MPLLRYQYKVLRFVFFKSPKIDLLSSPKTDEDDGFIFIYFSPPNRLPPFLRRCEYKEIERNNLLHRLLIRVWHIIIYCVRVPVRVRVCYTHTQRNENN